jgi:hypothetical protein
VESFCNPNAFQQRAAMDRNRKASRHEMACVRRVIRQAYPDWTAVFGGSLSRLRPRFRTISFRLRDDMGKYHCNVVWLHPDELETLTVEDIRGRVEDSNGNKNRRAKPRRVCRTA